MTILGKKPIVDLIEKYDAALIKTEYEKPVFALIDISVISGRLYEIIILAPTLVSTWLKSSKQEGATRNRKNSEGGLIS